MALFENWDMYTQALEDSANAAGTLQTQQDIYMESTAAHLQQLRTAAEGVYDSLLKSEDINGVVDVFTQWTQGIESVVDGLGGLKGLLLIILPLLTSALSTNVGAILGQGFSNFTIGLENKEKINQLTTSIQALGDAADPTVQKYLKLKDELAKSAPYMKPETFNKMADGIEKMAKAEAHAQDTAKKYEEAQTAAAQADAKATTAADTLKQSRQQAANVLKNITTTAKTEDELKAASTQAIVDELDVQVNEKQKRIDDEKKEIDKLKQDIQKRKEEIADLQNQVQNYTNSGRTAPVDTLNKINQLEQENKTDKSNINYHETTITNLTNQQNQLHSTSQQLQTDYSNSTNAIHDQDIATQHLTETQDRNAEAQARLHEQQGINIQNSKVMFDQLGQGIMTLTSAITACVAFGNALSNIARIQKDETIPETEKWKQILPNVITLLTSGTMAVTQFIKSIGTIGGAITSTVNIGSPALASLIAGLNGTTIAAGETAVAMSAILAPIIAIAAAIAALTIATIAITKAVIDASESTQEANEALERANKAVDAQKKSAEEATNKVNSLSNALDDLKEKENHLSELSKGTEEWNKQLQSVNDSILKLIEEYPELAKYLTITNGQYSLQKEGLEELQKTLEKNAKIAVEGKFATQITQKNANYNKDISTMADSLAAKTLYGISAKGEFFAPLHGDSSWTVQATDRRQSIVRNKMSESEEAIRAEQEHLLEDIKRYSEAFEEADHSLRTWNEIATDRGIVETDTITKAQEVRDQKQAEYDLNQQILENQKKYQDIQIEQIKLAQAAMYEAGKENINDFVKNTDKQFSEHQQDIIIAATTATQAEIFNRKLQSLDDRLYSSSDEVSANTEKELLEYYQKQYGDLYDSVVTTNDGVEGVWTGRNGQTFVSLESIKADFATYQTELEMATSETLEAYSNSEEKYALGIAIAHEKGILTIDKLNQQDIDTFDQVENLTEDRKQQLEQIKREFEQADKNIQQSLATRSERQGYTDAANKIANWESLTFEQKEQIAAKIHEAFKEGGSQGVEDLVNQMQDKDFEAAVTLTIKTPKEDLTQALKDAGVKQAEYDAELDYREQRGEKFEDPQTLINFLAAQKDLNNLYKERETIFSSLNQQLDEQGNFDWSTVNGDQRQYLIDIKQALDLWSGKDVKFDDIVTHLDLIKAALEGDAAAARKLMSIFNQIDPAVAKTEIDSVFEEYRESAKIGDTINADLKETIQKWANDLSLSDEEIKKLFANYNYIWVEDKQEYVYSPKTRIKQVFTNDNTDFIKQWGEYKEQQQLIGESYLDYKDWMESNGWSSDDNGLTWSKYELYEVERNYQEFWVGKQIRSFTKEDIEKLLQVLSEEELEDLGGKKLIGPDGIKWTFYTTYENFIKLQSYLTTESAGFDPNSIGGNNKEKTFSTSTTHYDVIETKIPALDTTDIDNQLTTLNDEIKEYNEVLSSLTPGTEAYLQQEKKVREAEREHIDLLKEKNQAAQDYIDTQGKEAIAAAEAATGIKAELDENGRIKNLSDFKNYEVSGSAYNVKNEQFKAAQDYYNSLKDKYVKKDENGVEIKLTEKDEGYTELTAAKEAMDDLEDEVKVLKDEHDELSKSTSNAIKGLENYDKAAETRYKTGKDIASEEKKAWENAAKDARTAADATAEQRAELEKLNNTLDEYEKQKERLGEAADFTGDGLVAYYEREKSLLDDINKAYADQDSILQSVVSSKEKAATGQLEEFNLSFSADDNGLYNIAQIGSEIDKKYQELLETNNEQAEKLIAKKAEIIKIFEDINSKQKESKELGEKIRKNLEEQAKINAAAPYAKVNDELEKINQKLDIAKEKSSDAKSMFDKAGTSTSIEAFKEWREQYQEYLDWLDKQGEKYKEKIQEIFSNEAMSSILKEANGGEDVLNLFNAETKEEFMAGYYDFVDNLNEIKDELKQKISDLKTELAIVDPEKDQAKWYSLTTQISDAEEAWEQLANAEGYATARKQEYMNQTINAKDIEALGKEWKTAAVDRQIKAVNRELSILQKQQSRIKGKNEVETLQKQIANLKKQQEVIKKHIELEKKKLQLMYSQLKVHKNLIQEMISELKLTQLGSAFDASGHVSGAFLEKLAKQSGLANDQVQALISQLKEYESLMKELESQQDVITGLGDDLADMNYEIAEKAWEETRKAAEKALNALKIHIEVQLNSADLDRKLDRLQARIDKIRDTDFANQALLDMSDAVSYMTRDVPALIDGVSQLMDIYNSGAWEDYYDTQKEAYDDILNFTNQMIDKVNAFYDALDAAREKYAQAIDKLTSQNKELLSDLDRINKLANHGINITKLLFGEESYDKLGNYFNMINAANTRMLEEAKKQRDYYAALLNTIDPVAHPEEYAAVKSALTEAIDEVYQYAESAINNLNAALENAIKTNAKNIREEIAKLEGYGNTAMKDLAHDRQQQILKDFLDITESEYEINSLINKFNKSINDTDSLAEKEKLAAVMKEQVGYLEEQIKKTGRLTKYEVDRANKIYELTLKQMALDEAKDNKTQMRLRRDSQGNYRYEYVADQSKTDDAAQAVLDAEYQLYELDKQRVLELTEQKKQILEDYLQRAQEIMQDESLSQEEKEQYLIELDQWTKDRLLELEDQFVEAQLNIRESAQDELDAIMQEIIAETGSNAEEVANNLMSVQDMVESLTTYSIGNLQWYYDELSNIMDGLIGQNGDLQSTIYDDVEAINGLIGVDYELISEWQNQVSAMQEVVAQLEELEHMYEEVAQAAAALASAVAQLDDPLKDSSKNNFDYDINSLEGGTTTANAWSDASGPDDGKKKNKDEDEDSDSGLESKYVYGLVVDENNRHHGYFTDPIGQEPFDDYDIQEIEEMTGLTYIPMDEVKRHGGVRIKNIWGDYAFDTGGYTGEWGSDGRVAVLHQKELVLNARDTENFLKATDIMRSLQNNLDTIKANVITQPNVNVTAPTADFNQNVRIEANFPNVSNSREIEEAFNNLVNLASQRAATLKR